jgi:hypothetical protein
MQCPSFDAKTTMRHDSLKGMFRPVACRAGIASTLQRALRSLPVLAEGAGISAMGTSILKTFGLQLGGDILLALPGSITVADVSVIHPLSINTLPAAAATAEAASCWPIEAGSFCKSCLCVLKLCV